MRHPGGQRNRTRRFPSCLPSMLLVAMISTPALAQSWPGYGHDPQHSCAAIIGSAAPGRILWSTPVDTDVQRSGNSIFAHYGSPMITRLNTVLVPVKKGAQSDFQVEAHRGTDGLLLWKQPSGWRQPPNPGWTAPFSGTLTPKDRYLVMPDAGGTVLVRTFPDSANGVTTRQAFYPVSSFLNNPQGFTSAIQICTPITSDALGNLFFGYVSDGSVSTTQYPGGIPSGLARISNTGVGSLVSVTDLTPPRSGMTQPAYNCAPALSKDGKTVYIAVSNGSTGFLCSANSGTLASISSVFLLDPRSFLNGNPQIAAYLSNLSSSTPTVGPDGDVYFGVLENNVPEHNDRGWMLHFDSTLTVSKTPGSFGWDDTASIVPASLVQSYTGPSKYLILTKYNDYADFGIGNGQNELAILDPGGGITQTQPDSYYNYVTVMKEVLTVVGPTANAEYPGVREWCINSAAIDPVNKCAVVNSEDGHVYRWDFTQNKLTSALNLQPPTGEAYTPTVIGPDGSVYAINNANLFCCVAAPAVQGGPGRLPILLDRRSQPDSGAVKGRRGKP